MTDQYDQNAEGDRYLVQSNALSAWFMGPRGENHEVFNELINNTIHQHQQNRRKYWPTDPEYVTKLQMMTPAYKEEKRELKKKLKEMNDDLQQSTPVFSPRFQGHMNWDISMPAVLGYISGMVWNPNNVDVTASPITTPYEIIAADQICDMIGFDRETKAYQPWGHITCGGSIANIEAVWSSRNMKFYPISLKDAVMAEDELEGAKTLEINVPAKPEPDLAGGNDFKLVELQNCSVWQLLNVDVDQACSMAQQVAEAAGVSLDTLSNKVHNYAYTSVGIHDFLKNHNIKSPRLFVPATCHYSWPKAATVLGLGEDNLIHIKVTDLARQNTDHLREELLYCVKNTIPVISVTAVIGSTEESAIDPLIEMLAMREKEFKGMGLNFALLADAAWGAYMRTMLIDPFDEEEERKARRRKGRKGREQKERRGSLIANYVPIVPLSKHAKDNLNALRYADTVTSDPHKTGYCPYPAGGLSYRNGTMKDFVLLAAPEVFHSEDDLSVGVNGLEGSKPGAAGAGVLLSHRVIGLDKYGYGRVLGQCVFGSKIFYCMWLHLAKKTDPFLIKPYIPCTKEQSDDAKQWIVGKSNIEILKNPRAMALLDEIGPDCMINKFAVNIIIDGEINNDVDISTEYSKKIGQLLSVNANKDNHRVELVIFQSLMETKTFGSALTDFETTLGLTKNQDKPFGCMVNTVMNPWQASGEFCWTIGEIYRETCLLAHGWQTDRPAKHRFVCLDLQHNGKNGWFMYASLVGKFGTKSEQYECIVNFALVNQHQALEIKDLANHGRLYVRNKKPQVLYQLLIDAEADKGAEFEFMYGSFADGQPLLTTSLTVLDKVRVKHFLTPDPDVQYPEHYQYFMFGEGDKVYLSHMITQPPDFQQIVEVASLPMCGPKDEWLLWYGFPVTFVDYEVNIHSPASNPLTSEDFTYNIRFTGEKQKTRKMSIVLKNNTGWFDNTALNAC